MIEDYTRPVRRPIKARNVTVLVGKFLCLSLAACIFCYRDHIEPCHLEVLIDPAIIVAAFVILLFVFRLDVGHRVGDPLSVRRPFKVGDAALEVCDLFRFTTAESEKIKIVTVLFSV